jgi:hypothetical protein
VGLERGPLSLVSTTEELLGRKSSGSGLQNREYGRRDPSRRPRDNLSPQKLALTLPTSSGLSVCIVRSRTQATEIAGLVSSPQPVASGSSIYVLLSSYTASRTSRCFHVVMLVCPTGAVSSYITARRTSRCFHVVMLVCLTGAVSSYITARRTSRCFHVVMLVCPQAQYVSESGLGGIMFGSIDNDDFRGKCLGRPYPLIEAGKEALLASAG